MAIYLTSVQKCLFELIAYIGVFIQVNGIILLIQIAPFRVRYDGIHGQ